jgi:Flp pilus assembly protein TadD
MFSKKKKVEAKAAPAAPAEAAAAAPAPAESPASDSASVEDSGSHEAASSGGLLSSGLGSKAKAPSIAASRLGGRPPSRPSAPAPPPAPIPDPVPEAPPAMATPQAPAIPFGGPNSPNNQGPGAASDSTSRVNSVHGSGQGLAPGMPGTVQGGLALQDAGPDGTAKGKNPYKLNPLFDVILPVSMSLILCGGFAMTTKVVKHKSDIYGLSEAEKQTQVRDMYLASAKLMDDIKKMEPIKLLDSGDAAGALAAAKPMGSQALALADQQGMGAPQKGVGTQVDKSELDIEEKAVRELLVAGMVMCKAGSKQEKDLGLTYMAKAEDIATYSKYVRLLYARELVRVGKRDDEAIKQYQDITTLFKDPWPLPHKELALLLMRNNRGTEAVQELTLLMKADPADPSYQRQLGLAMAQNNDQQAGFEEFQKGFTREQDVLSYPAAVKGLVEAHGGLVDATLADIKKQAEKSPNDLKLQLDLARLDIATLKYKDARDVMEKARKAHELDPEVHEIMAEVMCRQNQQSSGYDEFRSAAQNLHLQQ